MCNETSNFLSGENEIDLVTILNELRSQKTMIFFVIALALIIAIGYCITVKPVYMSKMVIAPAAISTYGSIAGSSMQGIYRSQMSPIALGAALSNDTFRLYLSNLESVQVRKAFHGQAENINTEVIIYFDKGRSSNFLDEPVTIFAESTDRVAAKKYLDALIAYSSSLTKSQLNEYFNGIGGGGHINSIDLFKVEHANEASDVAIKPKPIFVLTLSVVLGFVVGVFFALVRMLLRKNAFLR